MKHISAVLLFSRFSSYGQSKGRAVTKSPDIHLRHYMKFVGYFCSGHIYYVETD
jgi:hypothetical protein